MDAGAVQLLAPVLPPMARARTVYVVPGVNREFNFYKIEEARTKRPQETPSSKASLYSIGIGTKEVPEFDRTHFETQITRLVCRPERGADKPGIPLQPDSELQNKAGIVAAH